MLSSLSLCHSLSVCLCLSVCLFVAHLRRNCRTVLADMLRMGGGLSRILMAIAHRPRQAIRKCSMGRYCVNLAPTNLFYEQVL